MTDPHPLPDPASIPNEALSIGVCGPEHRAEQAELFNACFKKGATADDLAWRYDRGPHGGAISLVSRPPGGVGISGYACSPRKALVRGDEATLAPIGQTGDVMTHPAWRKRGIFSGLDRRAMEEAAGLGWPLVFGLPNRHSAHIFVELGWESVGIVRPYSLVLRATPTARAESFKDGRVRAWLTPWNARRGRGVVRRLAAESKGFRVDAGVRAIPDGALDLSRALERRFELMVRRDPKYLTWRFLKNPAGLHEVSALYSGEELVALVVVQRPREAGGVGYLVDVLAPEERALRAALGVGLARLQSHGAGVVQSTAIDGTWWREVLVRTGFLAPKPQNHLIVILHPHAPEHPLVEAARNTAGWYFTDGDRDDATMG